jgi:hypothetical protein
VARFAHHVAEILEVVFGNLKRALIDTMIGFVELGEGNA